MQCLKDSMTWDQDTYGREYDLDDPNPNPHPHPHLSP